MQCYPTCKLIQETLQIQNTEFTSLISLETNLQ